MWFFIICKKIWKQIWQEITGISSAKKCSTSKYGKKIIDTTKNEGIKKILTRTAEATGDLIGNKITDKITSLGNKSKNEESEEQKEIIISPEKTTTSY